MAISQSISALSTPPSRSDPTTFDSRADVFLGELPTLATQLNTWAGQANSTASSITSDASAANTAKVNAETAETNAETAQGLAEAARDTATAQAGIATTQAGNAATQAGNAATQAGIATTQAGIATAQAASAAAVVTGGTASLTPAAGKIPLADGAGKINDGWLSGTYYALATAGVTNGNSHDHSGGDGAQIAYSGLSGLPTLGTAAAMAGPSGAIVGTTDTQTLSGKTLTDPAIIGTLLEDIYTITDGAAFEIDPGNGSIQLITLGASRTPKGTNFENGESVLLMVLDGAAYAITWTDTTFGATGIKWIGGFAPTLNTTTYTFIELCKVGGQVYGFLVGAA